MIGQGLRERTTERHQSEGYGKDIFKVSGREAGRSQTQKKQAVIKKEVGGSGRYEFKREGP